MKKLMIYLIALIFSLTVIHESYGQKRGNHWKKQKKEYVKHHQKRQKANHKYVKEINKSYHKYDKDRGKAYRKDIKQREKHYRKHDAWYYNKRFHNRTEYVYFPAYRTYYDPYRRGYVYRRKDAWIFSQTLPTFMVGLNVAGLNVQFSTDLPL